MSRVLAAIEQHGPMTSVQLRTVLTCSPRTIARLISNARDEGQLYVVRWDREGEREYPMPVFALGALPDAIKPGPRTATEYQRKWRAKRGT